MRREGERAWGRLGCLQESEGAKDTEVAVESAVVMEAVVREALSSAQPRGAIVTELPWLVSELAYEARQRSSAVPAVPLGVGAEEWGGDGVAVSGMKAEARPSRAKVADGGLMVALAVGRCASKVGGTGTGFS